MKNKLETHWPSLINLHAFNKIYEAELIFWTIVTLIIVLIIYTKQYYLLGFLYILHITCVFLHHHKSKEITSSSKINYKQLKQQLKTGDLILFRTNNHYDLANFYIYVALPLIYDKQYMYSHIGLVYKENGRIYLIESTAEPHKDIYGKMKSGIRMMPIEQRIKNYDGIIAYKSCKKDLQSSLPKIKKTINPIYHSPWGLGIISQYQSICKLDTIIDDHQYIKKNGLGCMPFIMALLQKIGHIKPSQSHMWSNLAASKCKLGLYHDAKMVIS